MSDSGNVGAVGSGVPGGPVDPWASLGDELDQALDYMRLTLGDVNCYGPDYNRLTEAWNGLSAVVGALAEMFRGDGAAADTATVGGVARAGASAWDPGPVLQLLAAVTRAEDPAVLEPAGPSAPLSEIARGKQRAVDDADRAGAAFDSEDEYDNSEAAQEQEDYELSVSEYESEHESDDSSGEFPGAEDAEGTEDGAAGRAAEVQGVLRLRGGAPRRRRPQAPPEAAAAGAGPQQTAAGAAPNATAAMAQTELAAYVGAAAQHLPRQLRAVTSPVQLQGRVDGAIRVLVGYEQARGPLDERQRELAAVFMVRNAQTGESPLTPDTLDILLAHPDALAELNKLTDISERLQQVPGLTQALVRFPRLRAFLTSLDEDGLAAPSSLHGLFAAASRRGSTEALASGLARLIADEARLSLVEASHESAKRDVLHAIELAEYFDVKADWSEFRQAIDDREVLATALMLPRFARALHRHPGSIADLRLGHALLAVLREPDAAPLLDDSDLDLLLEDRELLLDLERKPRETRVLFRVPGMASAFVRHPEKQKKLLRILAGDPLLGEVLPTAKKLGQALAGDVELLEAAFRKPRLGQALSADPQALDPIVAAVAGRPDAAEYLRAELDALGEPASLPTAAPGAAPLVYLAAHPLAGPVLRNVAPAEYPRPALAGQLKQILERFPGLLEHPHEFRRLLGSHGLVQLLTSDTGAAWMLTTPLVLRAVLAQPDLRDMFDRRDPSAAAERKNLLVGLEKLVKREPRLVDMVRTSPVAAKFVRWGEGQLHRVLDLPGGFEALAADERMFSALDRSPAFLDLLETGGFDLEGARADNGSFLRMATAHRGAVLSMAARPERLEALVAHPELVRKLGQHLVFIGGRQWDRLLDDLDLLAALSDPRAELLLDGLLRDSTAFISAMGHPRFLRAVIERPDRFDDDAISGARLVAAITKFGGLDLGGDGQSIYPDLDALLEAIQWVFTAPLSEQRRTIQENDRRWQQTYLDARRSLGAPESEGLLAWAARRILGFEGLGRTAEQAVAGPVPSGLADRLQEVLRAIIEIPGLKPVVLKAPSAAGYLLHNPHLLETLHRRPALVGLMHNGPTRYLIAAEPRMTALLHDDGEFFAVFLHGSEMRDLLHENPALLERVLENPVLGTAITSGIVASHYLTEPAIRRIFHAVPKVVRVGADNPGVLTELRTKYRPLLTALDQLASKAHAGGPEVAAGATALIDAAFRHTQLRVLLNLRPGLVNGLAARPSVMRAITKRPAATTAPSELRRLLENPGLMAALEVHPQEVDFVLADERRLRVAAASPAIVAALAEHDSVRRLLRQLDGYGALLEMPGLAALVVEHPAFARLLHLQPALVTAIETDPSLVGLFAARPALAQAVGRNIALTHALRQSGTSGLGRALRSAPILDEVLGGAGVTPKLSRRRAETLDTYRGVSARIAESGPTMTAMDAGPLAALLDSEAAMRLLNDHPDFATRGLTDGRLLRALSGRGFAEAMAVAAVADPAVLSAPTDVVIRRAAAALSADRAERTAAVDEGVPVEQAGADAVAALTAPVRQGAVLRRLQSMSPELASAVTAESGLAELLERQPLAGMLHQHPELAVLMVWQPGLAAELAANPDDASEYAFRPFLQGRQLAEYAAADVAAFLGERGLALESPYLGWYQAVAGRSWELEQAKRRQDQERAEAAVQARLTAFNPLQPGQWTYSGEVILAGVLDGNVFAGNVLDMLSRIARTGTGAQESVVTLHRELHAHVDNSAHGVSFVFVLREDGRVAVLAYGYAPSRPDNKYRWLRLGEDLPGPMPMSVIEGHEALRISRLGSVRAITGSCG